MLKSNAIKIIRFNEMKKLCKTNTEKTTAKNARLLMEITVAHVISITPESI